MALEEAVREFKEVLKRDFKLQGKLIILIGEQHENDFIYEYEPDCCIAEEKRNHEMDDLTLTHTIRSLLKDCLKSVSREDLLKIFTMVFNLLGRDPFKICDSSVLSGNHVRLSSYAPAIEDGEINQSDVELKGGTSTSKSNNNKKQSKIFAENDRDAAYNSSGFMSETTATNFEANPDKDRADCNASGKESSRTRTMSPFLSELFFSKLLENRSNLKIRNTDDDSISLAHPPKVDDRSLQRSNSGKKQRTKEGCTHKKVKKQRLFVCESCGESCSSRLEYRKHLSQHVDSHKCNICDKLFKSKDSLYHHQRGIHAKGKPYQCKLCDKSFGYHNSYTLHLLRHKGERPYKCDLCPKTYLTSNHLKEHIQATHTNISIVCHVCGKKFSYVNALKVHLQSHSGEIHCCTLCFKIFNSKHAFNRHTKSHSNESFQCGVCKKYFKSEYTLKSHSKLHTKTRDKRFRCDICDKSFSYKCILERHAQSHNEFRTFVCIICGKVFKNKASLYTHQYVHSEEKPHVCSICGKSYKTKSSFVAHSKRHETRCTFKCSLCEKTFQDKGGLSKHTKTVHAPQRYYSCKICDKICTRADNLRTHVKSHKNEVGPSDNLADFILVHTN